MRCDCQVDDPMRKLVLILGMLIGLGGAACFEADVSATTGGDETETAEDEATSDEKPHYSSFGVSLRQGEEFNVISFKDVGLGRDDPTPKDPLLEAVAQSLSYEMRVNGELQLRPRVFFDKSLADPAEHRYCEANHLYVDIWRSENPEEWGYSLWSGCSKSQKFAWDEIPVPETTDDVAERVEPLTKEIAASIAEADREDCFRRAC